MDKRIRKSINPGRPEAHSGGSPAPRDAAGILRTLAVNLARANQQFLNKRPLKHDASALKVAPATGLVRIIEAAGCIEGNVDNPA
jgi:hypothetical protein